jgi:hypothetical protein
MLLKSLTLTKGEYIEKEFSNYSSS